MCPIKRASKTKTAVGKTSAEKSSTSKRVPRQTSSAAVTTEHTANLDEYNAKRDFRLTREPSGTVPGKRNGKALQFVVQKHAASHLHFDVRLECNGVMKSWAVPKGPSVDTSVKRLAMEVEDHPIAYNTFEGTIPQGEYGGGTVMLWDRGTYAPDEVNAGESDEAAVQRALQAGKLAFTFHGDRLHGSFALVRTRRGEERAQWLLIKHHDQYAKEGRDIVAEVTTSVATKRTMTQIAAGDNDVLESAEITDAIEPMLATVGKLPLPNGEYAIESVLDGKRVLAFVTNGTVQLVRSSHGKSSKGSAAADVVTLDEHDEVQKALLRLARARKGALVLDGFLADDAFVVIDLLLEDDALLLAEPWIERRTRLDAALINSASKSRAKPQALRVHEWMASSADDVAAAALALEVRDVIAKRVDSPYESGASNLWLQLRVEGAK